MPAGKTHSLWHSSALHPAVSHDPWGAQDTATSLLRCIYLRLAMCWMAIVIAAPPSAFTTSGCRA